MSGAEPEFISKQEKTPLSPDDLRKEIKKLNRRINNVEEMQNEFFDEPKDVPLPPVVSNEGSGFFSFVKLFVGTLFIAAGTAFIQKKVRDFLEGEEEEEE